MIIKDTIICPTCKKNTKIEISQAALKTWPLKHGSSQQSIQQNTSTTNRQTHVANNVQHRDYTKTNVSKITPNLLNHELLIHCSSCDNLFKHILSLNNAITSESNVTGQLSSPKTIEKEHQIRSKNNPAINDNQEKFLDNEFRSQYHEFGGDVGGSVFKRYYTPVKLKKALALETILFIKKNITKMIDTTAFKVILPSLCLLVVLFLVGLLPNNSISKLVSNTWPAQHSIPDSSIYIEASEADLITTTNDHRFIQIMGTIRNDGTKHVNDVIVQGLIYDLSGRRLNDALAIATGDDSTTGESTDERQEPANTLTDTEIEKINNSSLGELIKTSTSADKKNPSSALRLINIAQIAQGEHSRRQQELRAGNVQYFKLLIPLKSDHRKDELLYSARVFTIN
jgi:hypothetical protein